MESGSASGRHDGTPEQLSARLAFELSPQAERFRHERSVVLLLAGLPYHARLAVRAAAGVRQEKLRQKRRGVNHEKLANKALQAWCIEEQPVTATRTKRDNS